MGHAIAKQSGPSLPDLPTVTAIALVAYAASNVLHEAVGHGGACLALGGKALVLSSVHFECGEQAMSALALRGVAAGGTIVNFIVGSLALVVLKKANPLRTPHAAYFLWLFATLNLLSGAGYFLFSGVGDIGDWADVARGTMPPLLWRPAMSVFGGALYFLLARQSAQLVAFASWQRRALGEEKHTAHRPGIYRRGRSLLPLRTVQPSRPRPHRHFRRGVFFRWRLGASLANPVPASWRAVSSARRRAGPKLCLDRRRMRRLADLRCDSRARHSVLVAVRE